MLLTSCHYPCIGCYSLTGILNICQFSHVKFWVIFCFIMHDIISHNYCICVRTYLICFIGYFVKTYLGMQMRLNWSSWAGFVPHYFETNSFVPQHWYARMVINIFPMNRRNQEDMDLFSIILNQEIKKLSTLVCHFSLLEWTHLQRIFH